MNFRALKLAVLLPAIILVSFACSEVFQPGGYLLKAAIGIILLGVFISTGSASGTVFVSTVLYSVPYSIVLSQFLPIAFPRAYEDLAGAIMRNPYFSSPLSVFTLMVLSILSDYIERAEGWDNILSGLGWKGRGTGILTYGAPVLLLAFALSLGILWLGRVLNFSTTGILLPVLILLLGAVSGYLSRETGSYRRVVVATELPPVNGEVLIETPEGVEAVPLSRSMASEWEAIRVKKELKKRPTRVLLKIGERVEVLTPLMESVDGKTLFLLYRKEI
ncbi:hypothetical protein A3L12_03930 [Thermococcus sp. P6]|uniref:hypothetical protein n=1 Tax=Thermococcus sp. P6 TaxID=122420 RepID=UPI000B59A068|nr:hypothetical protein [Thermococcus sp. P6]ASJ10506.1 hypothetical protein A3L12_03930 [Thermococcus sp. P6]